MSKLKHTSGPWEINEYQSSPKYKITGIPKGESYNIEIARIFKSDNLIPEQENEDNVRLIASAPEMLDALIYFVRRVREGTIRSRKTYKKYIDVIEKATGQKIDDVLKEQNND